MRLLTQDEARFGLHDGHTRRRLTACGHKPVQLTLPRYEYYWIYGAVDPISGESFFLELPALDTPCFQAFLHELSTAFPTTMNVVLLDGAPPHTAKSLHIPDNILLIRIPPYCPELNPTERVWEDMRQNLSFDPHATLSSLVDDAAKLLRSYTPDELISLTGYDYLQSAYLAHAA